MNIEPTEPQSPSPEIQLTDPRKSSREKSVIVDNQPRPSRPMMSTNIGSQTGGDRNALRVPIMGDGLRPWSYGLFDCFSDLPTCVLSAFCCCCVYARNKRRFTYLETHGVPLRDQGGVYHHDCIAHVILQFLGCSGCALQAISRSDARRRYGIRGDAFNDVLSSGCCAPCQLVQEHREIQLEESSFYDL